MASAIANVETPVAVRATKLLINNRWVNSESGKTFATINPATGDEIAQVAEADSADVDRAVRAARAAFDGGAWRKISAPIRWPICRWTPWRGASASPPSDCAERA